MLIYPAVFTQDGDYIMVEFPEVPEALTHGDTLEEAFKMAVEVLGFSLEDQKELPTPSSLESIHKKYPDGQIALVNVDLAEYRRKYQPHPNINR